MGPRFFQKLKKSMHIFSKIEKIRTGSNLKKSSIIFSKLHQVVKNTMYDGCSAGHDRGQMARVR